MPSDLVNDDSPRLRDWRPTDDHPKDCFCPYCRELCCVPCHIADAKNTKTHKSIIAFGRHLQSKHPAWANHANHERRSKRIVKTLQDVLLAKENRRFERTGLRRIPIKRFDDSHLESISQFLRRVEADPTASLLTKALIYADERFRSKSSYESAIRKLSVDVQAGIKTGTYVTTERKTQFDPRVSLEILKLCWALGRGWSFTVHLLLLYGINAFVSEMLREGINPPTKVRNLPEPAHYLNQTANHLNEILEGLE